MKMISNIKCFATCQSVHLKRVCGFYQTPLAKFSIRRFSISLRMRNAFLAEKVETRSLVRLSGSDAPSFLQGLVTNDIKVIENSQHDLSLYCMMLNTQGRVLFDLLVYKVGKLFEKDKSIILECDSKASDDLIKTLSRYKLRKKAVSFSTLDDYKVWSAFPKSEVTELSVADPEKILFRSVDPRIPSFGHRLLLPRDAKGSEVLVDAVDVEGKYLDRRFDFGLAEGAGELVPGQSFPLECNLFFLNGVSFSKGCYVGQELTTRTHHTGVIRKRIMPLFSKNRIEIDESRADGLSIACESTGKECGKVRGWSGRKGLALLRLHEALLCPGPLVLRDSTGSAIGRVETRVPGWWPAEADEVIKKVRTKLEKS